MILASIIKNKEKEVAVLEKRIPLRALRRETLMLPPRKPIFFKNLKTKKPFAVIAEMKRKSPSQGLLRENFDSHALAASFEASGAAALSVLTDEKYFGGSAAILETVRAKTSLPILRKDFLIKPYQIYESRLIGADAILLIAAILTPGKLKKLSRLAHQLALDVLFEVHDEKDLKKVLPLKPKMIGVNNRNLSTFQVDPQTTARLARQIPKGVFIVSESGIETHEDLIALKKQGIHAALVGTSLMRKKDPGLALRRLLGAS